MTAFDRNEALEKLTSVSEPIIVSDGYILDSQTFRILTEEGAYLVEFDEPPVTGPYEISEEEIAAFQKSIEDEDIDGYFEPGDVANEMFQADCEPGVAYFRYHNPDVDDEPIFSENLDEFTDRIIEDVVASQDCQIWNDMSDEDLEEWQRWYELR